MQKSPRLQITGSFSGYLLGVQDSSMVSIDQRKAVSRFFQNGDYEPRLKDAERCLKVHSLISKSCHLALYIEKFYRGKCQTCFIDFY